MTVGRDGIRYSVAYKELPEQAYSAGPRNKHKSSEAYLGGTQKNAKIKYRTYTFRLQTLRSPFPSPFWHSRGVTLRPRA